MRQLPAGHFLLEPFSSRRVVTAEHNHPPRLSSNHNGWRTTKESKNEYAFKRKKSEQHELGTYTRSWLVILALVLARIEKAWLSLDPGFLNLFIDMIRMLKSIQTHENAHRPRGTRSEITRIS